MTRLTEPATADLVDPLRSSSLVRDVRVTVEQADAAWAYLKKHCEDHELIGQMLGVIA